MKFIVQQFKDKWLVTIPIVFLMLFTTFFIKFHGTIKELVIAEKFVEITNLINVIAEGSCNEENIIHKIEYVDKFDQVYAAAYRVYNDDELVLLSNRKAETSMFNLQDHPSAEKQVLSNRHGTLVVRYTPDTQVERDLFVYYRRIDVEPNEEIIVLGGISQYSITSKVLAMIDIVFWMCVTTNVALALSLVALFYRAVYQLRDRIGSQMFSIF